MLNHLNDGQNQSEILAGYSTSMVVRETGVSLRQLYYWENLGFIQPKMEQFGTRLLRRYDQDDVQMLKIIMKYLEEGYNLRTAVKKAQDEKK